ncbi:hypothetical protein Srot_1422 [Segniliparus rotundus DSM 44985]|uniref:Uncharacterized protein n=1 Tax=Segniliparus rotundus (strain ATCC BAA-972 / CDC 1076 / CIP 108378 / DSM 44985 / JCM 13578) TaxID=640132 RepID=D6Z7F6_SEGRD|nr:hypothetical protein [Segniliparus rotundus]ADG97886.1 hypothetical protein Srot_1422 [Segniliparus rotundus DSM 44985]
MTNPLQVNIEALAQVGKQMAEHAGELKSRADKGVASGDAQGSPFEFLAHYLQGLSFAAALTETSSVYQGANRRVCGEYENFGQALTAVAHVVGETDEDGKQAIASVVAA